MANSTDRTGAAVLVAAVVLLAGSLAGFSAGARDYDMRRTTVAPPLLLQSAAIARTLPTPCDEPAHAPAAQPALSTRPQPLPAPPPLPAPTPRPRVRPINT